MRTLCFRHAHDIKEIYLVSGAKETPVFSKTRLYTSAYSDPITLKLTGSELGIALPSQDTEKHPNGYRIFARTNLPQGGRHLAIFLPTNNIEKPYRLIILDESEKAFPMGSTLVYNLSNTDFRITLGERAETIKPLKRTTIPLPKKTNKLRQATVRTYFKDNTKKWVVINSTVWKTSEKLRGLAIAYIHPLNNKPVVTCFQETPPWRLPKLE
ncbi:MAG: hypothetical protein AB8F34_15680 [Akkermansiaceae bacterium]